MNNIFGFHGFTKNKFSINFSDINVNTFTKFVEELLSNNKTFCNISNYNSDKVAIYFDDAKLNIYKPLIELKKRFPKFTATIFVIGSSLKDNKNRLDIFNENYLSYVQIKELHNLGFEIGSHSYSHMPLNYLPKNQLIKDIKYSKTLIEDCINNKINSFSLPYGSYNKDTIDIIKSFNFTNIVSINKKGNIDNILSAWPIHRLDNFHTIYSRLNKNNYIYKINMINKNLYNQFSKGSIILKRLLYL